MPDRSYQKLKRLITVKRLSIFRKLDWNRVIGKQDYAFKKSEDYQKLKEEDIKGSFVFKEEKELEDCA